TTVASSRPSLLSCLSSHHRAPASTLFPYTPLFRSLQLKLLTTYIPKTSAFTLAFSTSQRLRTTRASARTLRGTKGKRKGARLWRSEERFSRNAETDLVCRLLLDKTNIHFVEAKY